MTAIYSTKHQYIAKKHNSSFTELCLVGIIGFFGAMGTGSTSNYRERSQHAAYITPSNDTNKILNLPVESAPLSISEQISIIKDSFGLNISAIANLLNVSRTTVYSWIKGEPPKLEQHLRHLDDIVNIAKKYSSLNLDRPDNFIKRPLFNGQSFFALLQSGAVISDDKYTFIQDLDRREAETRITGLKRNELRTSSDVLDELI